MKKNVLLVILGFSFFSPLAFGQAPAGEKATAKKTIAIIGGGMAGVSAAALLKDSGYEVHVFEKETQLGGHAQTQKVKGGDHLDEVSVDLGPQYFAPGGWDTYIQFLQHFDLYDREDRTLFAPSISIYHENKKTPYFATPKLARGAIRQSLRPGNILRAMKLLHFLFKANKVYKNPKTGRDLTVGEWLDNLKYNTKFKNEVIRPLLVSVSNTSLDNIDSVSILHLVQGVAFRQPFNNKFFVSNLGLGTLIQKIAEKVEKETDLVHFHVDSAVTEVQPKGDKYLVKDKNGREILVDELVMALHPYQAAKILQKTENHEDMVKVLEEFSYAPVTIALHTDRNYVRDDLKGFYNLKLKDSGKFSLTMNLGAIHPKYGKVLKTWVYDKAELEELKKKGHLLASADFYHPIVTPKFLELQDVLKKEAKKKKHIHFIGGWTSLFESQNSAIMSAYGVIKDLAPEKTMDKWRENIPTMNEYGLKKIGLARDVTEVEEKKDALDCKER